MYIWKRDIDGKFSFAFYFINRFYKWWRHAHSRVSVSSTKRPFFSDDVRSSRICRVLTTLSTSSFLKRARYIEIRDLQQSGASQNCVSRASWLVFRARYQSRISLACARVPIPRMHSGTRLVEGLSTGRTAARCR